MIDSVWQRYKANYIDRSGRSIDKQRGDVTTSEGQSYAMLRAVWMDDKEMFDQSWQWTKDNLRRDDSRLFSWLFGLRADGTYGILTEQKGQNTASDADTDIALALAFAFARWSDPIYLSESKAIIEDIWENEVVMIGGKPYIASDNVQKRFNKDIIVNPSYMAPYAYRIFGQIDQAHDWLGLVDTSYEVIEEGMTSRLSASSSAVLPPNWARVTRLEANVLPPDEPGLDANFGYDALRVPWRLALDWKWNNEPRAERLLKMMDFLKSEWMTREAIYDIYAHDGRILDFNEVPAMYGGILGAMMAIDPNEAKDIYEKKLISLYNPDSNSWKAILGYYDDNWAWFGIALYNDELPNLWIAAVEGN